MFGCTLKLRCLGDEFTLSRANVNSIVFLKSFLVQPNSRSNVKSIISTVLKMCILTASLFTVEQVVFYSFYFSTFTLVSYQFCIDIL